MNHMEAVSSGATERYILGELTEEEREQYEEHFFDCPECAADVKAAAGFVEHAKAVFAEAPRASEVEDGRRSRGGWLRWLSPVPVPALAALVVVTAFGAYQRLVVVPRLETELEHTRRPQAVSWNFINAQRSDAPVVSVPESHAIAGFSLAVDPDQSFPYYRCEVRDARGNVRSQASVKAGPPDQELQITIPLAGLESGGYSIVLSGLESEGGPVVAADVARYFFNLQRGKR